MAELDSEGLARDPRGGISPELSVLIVNYNSWMLCVQAVATLHQHPPVRPDGSPMPFEVIVVDNASPMADPGEVQALREQVDAAGGKLILHDENGGYSKGMNLALGHARGRWILVSNPDVRFLPDTINPLLRCGESDPAIGMVVPQGFFDGLCEGRLPPNDLPSLWELLAVAGSPYWRWLIKAYGRGKLRRDRTVWEATVPTEVPMISGCMFLMPRELVDRIGLLDERYPLYFEDSDAVRNVLRAGRRIVLEPKARLVHYYNRSGDTAKELAESRWAISRRRYFRKWYGWAGAGAVRLAEWLENAKGLRRFRKAVRIDHMRDLGNSAEPPVVPMPRRCERVLLEVSPDARFFLSGSVEFSGDRWSPQVELMRSLASRDEWFFRAWDISGGQQEWLQDYVWRYDPTAAASGPAPSGDAAQGAAEA